MLLTILSAIIALSVLIIFHELGHFWVAKRAGIRVDEFSIGLGPKVIGIKRGDTTYRLSLIPFGGYVKLAGMVSEETEGKPDEFNSKPARVRVGVIVFGPVFNLLLAFIFFTLTPLIFGIQELPTRIIKSAGEQTQIRTGDEILSVDGVPVETWDDIAEGLYGKENVRCLIKRDEGEFEAILYRGDEGFGITPLVPAVIGKVQRGSPAWKAGLRGGDRLTRINDIEISDWDTLVAIIQKYPEKEITAGWLRNGNYMEAKLTPKREQRMVDDKIEDIGVIGILIKTKKKSVVWGAFRVGLFRTTGTVILTFSIFKKLIVREISPKLLGGPVSIVRVVGESAKWGLETFLGFVAFLSIQLFIINLVPFPPLDGGQILLIGIERIRKKPVSERGISLIQNIGFACLIVLMLYVTFNDIIRLFK